jgi:predicted Zn-dependent peptidase
MEQSYNPSSILMISAGDIQPQLLTQIIARYFEDMPVINRSRQQNRLQFCQYSICNNKT